MSALRFIESKVQRIESIIKQTRALAAAAASGVSNTGYDVIVSGIVNAVPNDNVFHTIASYDLTAVQRAAYIEFQWLVRDPIALTMSARRQGAAFDATGGVGTVDNPVPLKNNMAVAPGYLFTTIGTLLVAQVQLNPGVNPSNCRAVIKIQFLT